MEHHTGYKLCEDYRVATFGNTVTEPIKFSACTLPSDIILTANDFGYNDGEFVIYDGNSITFKSDYWSCPNSISGAINFEEFEVNISTTNPLLILDATSAPAFVFILDGNGIPIESQAITKRANDTLQKMMTGPDIYCHLLSLSQQDFGFRTGVNKFEDYEVVTMPSLVDFTEFSSPTKCRITPGTSVEPLHFTVNTELTLPEDIKIGTIAFYKDHKDLLFMDVMPEYVNYKKGDTMTIEERIEVVYETGVILI